MLTEIASSIIENKKVQTIHVTEVPDQTFIDDDFFKKDPKIESIDDLPLPSMAKMLGTYFFQDWIPFPSKLEQTFQ